MTVGIQTMNPSNPNDKRSQAPLVPERASLQGPQIPARGNSTAINAAAAHIVRDQLNSIYNGNTTTPTPQTTPVAPVQRPTPVQPQPAPAVQKQPVEQETPNPYERTHGTHEEVQAQQWKQYHSAWQDYYQKYYERYYMGQVYHARQTLEAKTQEASSQHAAQPEEPEQEPDSLSREEALYDLRSKLLSNVRTGAQKVRKSRHFVPIAAALCVVTLFLFLQYNRILIANVQAYISPGDIDPANIIINPSTDVAVSTQPKLIIPKINVDVPVVWSTKADYDSQMAAMQHGVAWFGIPGANSHPGQVGNTVLSGHSSNDVIDKGDYKFIFARLDHMTKGDSIFVNYQGKRYTYTVTRTEVVRPTQVNKLVYKTTKPVLTLITCTPLGTSLNRLLITAEQVSPDPSDASSAPADAGSTNTTTIPGDSPTLLERIFGGNDQ
jgi:sortase A